MVCFWSGPTHHLYGSRTSCTSHRCRRVCSPRTKMWNTSSLWVTEFARAHKVYVLFVAGDGLALMRVNHLLKSKSDLYIDTSPVLIPIQGLLAHPTAPRSAHSTRPAFLWVSGSLRAISNLCGPTTGEHPHGLFHLMHCEWRLHRQFIMWCAAKVDNRQVVEDPSVSQFNSSRFFFLNVLTRACAEYINFLANSPGAPSFDDPAPILAHAEANIDFAWVCHFLYDAGFFVLDFLQGVRANESRHLDLLWREFFASAHTGTANKTQYVPMSIMRVFWGLALEPQLDALYHRIRTIPSSQSWGCGVGWDMAVEMLNAAIKSHIQHQVSHEQISNFLANWALIESVQARLRDYIYGHRQNAGRSSHSADATTDVNKLVDEFKSVIGTTWSQAIRPNSNSHLTSGPQRASVPWREVQNTMTRTGQDAPHSQIRKHVAGLTPFFHWAP